MIDLLSWQKMQEEKNRRRIEALQIAQAVINDWFVEQDNE